VKSIVKPDVRNGTVADRLTEASHGRYSRERPFKTCRRFSVHRWKEPVACNSFSLDSPTTWDVGFSNLRVQKKTIYRLGSPFGPIFSSIRSEKGPKLSAGTVLRVWRSVKCRLCGQSALDVSFSSAPVGVRYRDTHSEKTVETDLPPPDLGDSCRRDRPRRRFSDHARSLLAVLPAICGVSRTTK
jgi:hypothetical protein